jgi:hypothetical protein
VVDGAAYADLDVRHRDQQSRRGRRQGHVICYHPAVALLLATEAGTGLLAPLLGADPTSATSRSILGVPLYVSQYAPANTVYALDSTRVTLVIREDSTVAVSTDAYFSSDRVGPNSPPVDDPDPDLSL